MDEDLPGVSQTALWVANMRAVEGSRADRLFDDPLASVFASAAANDRLSLANEAAKMSGASGQHDGRPVSAGQLDRVRLPRRDGDRSAGHADGGRRDKGHGRGATVHTGLGEFAKRGWDTSVCGVFDLAERYHRELPTDSDFGAMAAARFASASR